MGEVLEAWQAARWSLVRNGSLACPFRKLGSMRPTFVAVHQVVLDHDAAAIHCVVLLRLAPHLTEVLRLHRLLACYERRDAKHMARQKLLGGDDVCHGAAVLGIARREKHISRGDKQDVVGGGTALGWQRAFEEGAEEGV